eukprot:TRINITY_DN912_c0_g1_i1.p1 TRINITY_DN912_c0_g1~~TRINITY_DN912_c0_g1_i1.p1  ORF type:complete len:281 (+),score=46.81 TRINITY_DN912_c0_g1_i1:61-903(+)
MATWALGWLQNKIGLDITGEQEYAQNHQLEVHKKQDDETAPTETSPSKDEQDDERRSEERLAQLQQELSRLSSHGDDKESRKRLAKSKEKGERIVSITPSKMYFPLPLDKFIMNTLTIQNTTEHYAAFKIKATAPARYAVKPRHGVLHAKEQQDVHITLRPTTEDPSTLHDKFLVESRIMTSEEVDFFLRTADIHTLWRVKREGTSACKIRCKFTSHLPANFIVKSVVESTGDPDDEDRDQLAEADGFDDEEAGEILPDAPMNPVTHKRHGHRVSTAEAD